MRCVKNTHAFVGQRQFLREPWEDLRGMGLCPPSSHDGTEHVAFSKSLNVSCFDCDISLTLLLASLPATVHGSCVRIQDFRN